MKFGRLFLWDLRFQAKYGFYFLYTVLTVIYTVALCAIEDGWKEYAAAILIFSDPAAIGLFFMGAIILLEKSQQIPSAYAVLPVTPIIYIVSKVTSLSAISLIVATVLSLVAGAGNILIVLMGTIISSVIFSLIGIIIATKTISLNQFILLTVPIEIISFVPALLYLFKITPDWLGYYFFNVCMQMISGNAPSVIGMLILGCVTIFLFVVAKICVLKMWNSMGGAKL